MARDDGSPPDHAGLDVRRLRQRVALPDPPAEPPAEYDRAPVSLALYLAAQLVDAAQDLAHVPAGHLHYRFVGWTR